MYITGFLLLIICFALFQLLLLTEKTNRFTIEHSSKNWNQPGIVSSHNTIQQLAFITSTPPEYIVLQNKTSQFTLQEENILLENSDWTVRFRPIVGDHIHLSVEYWIGSQQRAHDHDRPIEQPIPYESGPDKQCKSTDKYAYTKIWPHSGIHTHCDGLIHIHPWSAPYVWRLEGKRVVMAAFFDSVGIRYYETPLRLEFEDGTSYTNNKTHVWRLDLRINYNITSIYTHFDRLWLPHAYANIRVVYDTINSKLKQWPTKNFGTWGAHGFQGKPYPLI